MLAYLLHLNAISPTCVAFSNQSAWLSSPPLLPPLQAMEASQLRQQVFEQQRAAREAESAVCAAARDKEELSARVALLAATVDQLEWWGRASCQHTGAHAWMHGKLAGRQIMAVGVMDGSLESRAPALSWPPRPSAPCPLLQHPL